LESERWLYEQWRLSEAHMVINGVIKLLKEKEFLTKLRP
jgi:hypothetical protein